MSQLAYKEDYLTLYTDDGVQDGTLLSWSWVLPQAFYSPLRATGAWVSLVQHSALIQQANMPSATIPAYVIEYDGGSNNFTTKLSGGTLAVIPQGTTQLTSAVPPKIFVASCPNTIRISIKLPTTGAIPTATTAVGDVAESVFVLRFEYLPQEQMRAGEISTFTPTVV